MAKILIITSRFPFPLEKGDKLRIYNQVVHLGKAHEVHLVALNHKAVENEHMEMLTPHCRSVIVHVIPVYKRILSLSKCLFNGMPLQVQYFFSAQVKKKVAADVLRIKPDAIYSHLIRTSEYVKEFTQVSKTIDYMDCFSRGMELRINKTKAGNPLKPVLRMEHRRLLKYESEIFDRFQHCIIISAQDRSHLPHILKNEVEVVANGVDISIFHPLPETPKYQLLFTGNMGYPPNIEAAHFAATRVIPLLTEKYPDIVLLIAGVNPPARIRKLQNKNIRVIAQFDHIRLAFAQSEINLVPAVSSIGLQNKILQAMAMKIPTVTNLAGARGISAEQENVLLVGETPEEMAAHIVFLLENKAAGMALAEKAYAYVLAGFDWQIHNEKLERILLT